MRRCVLRFSTAHFFVSLPTLSLTSACRVRSSTTTSLLPAQSARSHLSIRYFARETTPFSELDYDERSVSMTVDSRFEAPTKQDLYGEMNEEDSLHTEEQDEQDGKERDGDGEDQKDRLSRPGPKRKLSKSEWQRLHDKDSQPQKIDSKRLKSKERFEITADDGLEEEEADPSRISLSEIRDLATDKQGGKNSLQQARVNDAIRVKEFRLVDEKGKQLGVKTRKEAFELAATKKLDLLQVSPDHVKPPVVKMVNFRQVIQEQMKKEKVAKKKQKGMKELQFKGGISPHDLSIKLKHAQKFLHNGYQVKFTYKKWNKESNPQESFKQFLSQLDAELRMHGKRDTSPKHDLYCIFNPLSQQQFEQIKTQIAKENATKQFEAEQMKK